MIVTSSSIKTPPPPHPPNPWAASQNPNNSFLPINRRSLLAALTISTTTTPFAHTFVNPMSAQEVAFARGLFQMPPVRLTNRYIVPEYSFLDARGLGAYEGKKLEAVSEVYASDTLSPTIKPPPIDDGTPNESVSDVFVRVIQLMSILETQYSEDTVIIVSPDSDNLTILQAGIIGLDLRRHRELSFAPGEVRFVDTSSVPTYKQPASAVYKCLKPPNCN
ncbi:hypothetical protein PRUPE_5G175000 [Prunus persica]|uniref:Phosphoglycerate mutase family protein n=1 Tax=Prunus persica TaxID=3760 RepID=A0A251PBH5_PRUPE|nr:hypothetical protein PRUPE_5G175000 [Prunus persica]